MPLGPVLVLLALVFWEFVIFKEKISLKKMLGIFLIIVGCVIMNFF